MDVSISVEDLVVQARSGDTRAYDAIYQRFRDMAFACAYSILGDHQLAEDASQEAFIGAYCDLMSLREPAAFPGWLRQIVRRHSLLIQRGRQSLLLPLDDGHAEAASGAPGPAVLAEREETRAMVAQALQALPQNEREAIRLYYFEDLSLKNIGVATGVAAGTVKSRLHSARIKLRVMLMRLVKTTLSHQYRAGDRTAAQSATAEAIAQFDRQARALLRVPTEEDQRQAGDLLCAKGRMLRFLGRMEDAAATFRAGMGIPALKRSPEFLARFHAELGLTHVQTAHYNEARRELETSCKMLDEAAGAPALRAVIHNGLGICAWGRGDFDQAHEHYARGLEESRRADSPALEAEALNNLALLDWKQGRLEESLKNFRVCQRRWKALRNRFAVSLTLMNVGILEENLGRRSAAQRHYDEAIALAREVNFVQVQAAATSNLGNLALNEGEWKRAERLNADALALARRIADRRSQAIALENIALALMGQGRRAEAWRSLQEGRSLATTIGDRERLFSLDLVEVEAYPKEGDAAEALKRIPAAAKALKAGGYTAELPRLLRLMLQAEIDSGAVAAALTTLAQAQRECRRQKNRPEEFRIKALSKRLKRKTTVRKPQGDSSDERNAL